MKFMDYYEIILYNTRMKTISLALVTGENVTVDSLEIFKAVWGKRNRWLGYVEHKRPRSAFFFVLSQVVARFHDENGREVVASAGDVVYIPSGIRYGVYFSGGNEANMIESYTLDFTLSDERGEEVILSDRITGTSGDAMLHEETLRKIDEEYHSMSVGGYGGEPCALNLRLRSLFYSLLCSLSDAAHRDEAYPLRRGVEALRQNWNKNDNIDEYAALCGMSPGYFYHVFKKWSGKSPVEYRNLLRVSNACSMLARTDMPISEIAALVGFSEQFYFCRVFRKITGLSPLEYRKQHLL